LRRHGELFLVILQHFAKAISEAPRITGRIKLDCQVFTFGHLPKIRQVGANDGHSVSARQMRDAAGSRG